MTSHIRNPKDFWAALIYLAVAGGAIVIGRDYPMGTAFKMGPAYFPTVLAALLVVIGVGSLVRSFTKEGEPIAKFAWKPLLLIVAAVVVFGLLARGAGLAVALPLLVLMTAFASTKFNWKISVAIATGATIFCSLVFVKGLRVPLPIIGRWFGS